MGDEYTVDRLIRHLTCWILVGGDHLESIICRDRDQALHIWHAMGCPEGVTPRQATITLDEPV